jgi:hypothetical protein
MKTDIMDDGFFERLVEGAKTIPKNWNQRCRDSIHKEKAKIAEHQNRQFEPPKACSARTAVEGDTPPPKTAKRTLILAKSTLKQTDPLPILRGGRTL